MMRGEAPDHVVNKDVLGKESLKAKLRRYREGWGAS